MLFKQIQLWFDWRILTEDEYWVYHFKPETKKQVQAVEAAIFTSPEEGKGHFTCWESDDPSLLDVKVVVSMNSLLKGQTISEEHYAN